jgi:acetyl esterase/lipase
MARRVLVRGARFLPLALLAALAAAAVPASANVPPRATISLPVRVPTMGNYTIGTGRMTVTYTDSDATAVASAASVGLGAGNVFRIDTCVKAHALNTTYDSNCTQKTVDTQGNAGTIYVAAPTTTERLARPAAGGKAYLSFVVSVSNRQSDGTFKEVASSWPDVGLAGGSVAVPVVGASTAAAPTSEGVLLSNAKTGGVNSGQPDSMCGGYQWPDPGPPGAGVSTSGMGAGAPAYYEVGEPTGDFAGQAPKGVMLLIHGGGWAANGVGAVGTERADADRWRARGWRTVNLTYHPCNASLGDVQWFYDRARTLWGSNVPYCAEGGSAGGNLALLLAASRSSLSCAVDEAGPTDALSIKDQRTSIGGTDGPRWVYNLLVGAVGQEMAVWWSPALFTIKARVLFAVAANDPYIPWDQGTEIRSKMQAANASAYADLVQLNAGSTYWVHSNVDTASLQTFYDHEQQLVAPLVGA